MIVIAHNIRSMYNVGSIFRNAGAFGVEKLYLTGYTATPPRKEIAKVALGAETLVDWETGEILEIIDKLKGEGVKVVALEIGEDAVDIQTFIRSITRVTSPDPSISGGENLGMELRMKGDAGLHETARDLRRSQTEAEKLLWGVLRAKKLNGYKFRRQHQLGQFIVDFYCDRARLIVEVDGDIHNTPENQERDRLRQEWLELAGDTVLRFSNEETVNEMDKVLKQISHTVEYIAVARAGAVKNIQVAVILGNEVEGIELDVLQEVDQKIMIPMQKKRSLNVSVAGGIAMYELQKF